MDITELVYQSEFSRKTESIGYACIHSFIHSSDLSHNLGAGKSAIHSLETQAEKE
jgi:hypothetical protein